MPAPANTPRQHPMQLREFLRVHRPHFDSLDQPGVFTPAMALSWDQRRQESRVPCLCGLEWHGRGFPHDDDPLGAIRVVDEDADA